VSPILIAVCSAFTVALVAYAIYEYFFGLAERRGLRRRLVGAPAAQQTDVADAPTDLLRKEEMSSSVWLNALLARVSFSAQLERLRIEAGVGLSVVQILYIMGALMAVVLLLLELKFPTSLPVEVITAAGIGCTLPVLGLLQQRKRRFAAFTGQFPGALEMIKSSIHAGHSLNYALEVAVTELPDPIAGEFRLVLEEIRLGLTPREALENLTKRVPISELRFFMLAVVLTREVGGNLSEVLGSLANTLRERQTLRQKVRALSAQGRASAIMLSSLPYVVGFFANLTNPGFLNPLYETPLGRKAVMLSLGLQGFALFLVKRICNPKELRIS
jgi:tight adherence protein B